MSWKIRFYSGLNQGVEISLEPGPTVLGSDPLVADWVLIDEGIAAAHLTIDVSENAVILASFADNITPFQNGSPLIPGSTLQPLSCQIAGPLIWTFCATEDAFPEQLVHKRTDTTGTAVRNKPKVLGYTLAGFSLLLLLITAGLLSENVWRGRNGDDSAAEAAIIASFLKAQRFNQIEIDPQLNSGVLRLHGYLEDDKSRMLLQRFLEREKLPFLLDIRTQEEIKQQVDFIIQKFGYEHVIASNTAKAGWILLSGQVNKEDDNWRQIETVLKRDVPGLLGIENQARVTGEHLVRLQQLLERYSLKEHLKYQEMGERIEVHGQLNDAQNARFALLQTEFNRDFGGNHLLELIAPANKKALVFTVKAVSIGKVPYVVLTDNRKYTVGSTTPEGVKIVAIQRDRIVLLRDKQQYLVNIKGNE